MNITFKDNTAEKNYIKADDNIRNSLQNAAKNYNKLKTEPDYEKIYGHPMNDIPINTETCMAAFGDMLATPVPEKVLIYTVGKRSRKKPIIMTTNLEFFKWYLVNELGLSLKNVNGHSSRYWVERNSYPTWLIFDDEGVCNNPLYEPQEIYTKYLNWCINKDVMVRTDKNGVEYTMWYAEPKRYYNGF